MRHPHGVTKESSRLQEEPRRSSAGVLLRMGVGALFACLGFSMLAAQTKSLAELAPRKTAPAKSSPNIQRPPATTQQPDLTWLQDALKDPELMAEVGRLAEKLQKGVSYPAARRQSRILPGLSDSTLFYAALPNYGDTLHQAFQIFEQGVNESPHLRAFLQKNNFDAVRPSLQNGVQRLYEISQYLGDEVVITGRLQGKEPSGVLIAEIKKPGVREALDKLNSELFPNANDRLRIFGPEQLTAAGETDSQAPAVLIRRDYIICGLSLASLRDFNSQLDERGTNFTSHPLGDRLARAYQQGTNTLIGVDLHQLIGLIPANKAQEKSMLEKTGFADVAYLVSDSTLSANGSRSQGEVAFNGRRRGIASWIAAPAPMGGLDFVPANTAMALDMILKNPGLMLDDMRETMGEASFASIGQMETGLNLNLKRDLLSKLTGEIVIAGTAPGLYPLNRATTSSALVPGAAPRPKPGPFQIVLGVSDEVGLQQTLAKLMTKGSVQTAERQEQGVAVHTVTVPSTGGDSQEINYFFLDGYLIIASDGAVAEESLRVHRGGTSLAKSSRLRESLGRNQSTKASIIVYQNASQMMAPVLAQLPPELRQLIGNGTVETPPTVFVVDADETSLRGFTSNNVQGDLTVGMIVAAVAIPSMMHARVGATVVDDTPATTGIRKVTSAQVTYSATYPDRGYASGLSLLGPGSAGACNPNADHACLLDSALASTNCTTGKWCEKGGYKFSVRGVCMMGKCPSYVVSATPSAAAAGKSFCSTEDSVIRSHSGPSLSSPLTAAECKTWMPMR